MKPADDKAYGRACEQMAIIVAKAIIGGSRPEFLLPPQTIAILASLEQVPGIAKNDDARDLVRSLCELVEGGPSLLMLGAVLEYCHVPFERAATLEELGLKGTIVPLAKGGTD